MNAVEKAYYAIEFYVTYGERIESAPSKRTAKKVVELIAEKKELNKYYLLHKMGYEKYQFNKWNETLEKMDEVAKLYC